MAGISLPRIAQDQSPGIYHVGIYVGIHNGQHVMGDAPHTGADVRVEPFPATIGASWGAAAFVGATAP